MSEKLYESILRVRSPRGRVEREFITRHGTDQMQVVDFDADGRIAMSVTLSLDDAAKAIHEVKQVEGASDAIDYARPDDDRDWRELAALCARVHPDGSMTLRGDLGEIPAKSFAKLYAAAPRAAAPNSERPDNG